MDPNGRNAETLFHQALEVEPNERAAFLTSACGSDMHLRRRVEALLAAHEQARGFLPEGTAGGASSLLGETPLTESTGTVIGRYKLLEKLGEGGFGVVWAAEQSEPIRRRVALKIIKLGMDTKQVIARFEAERQALALMDHPNIAKVLDAGSTERPVSPSGGEGARLVRRSLGEGGRAEEEDANSQLSTSNSQLSAGRPYFVMELVRGIPITQYCEQERLSITDRLDLFIKICHAIQHAHQKGIIHRDIKPSNIMVTMHDGVPVPKVIDFGIAKATQAELTEKTVYTQFQQFIGTPAYMSPEQAELTGLDIDTRSDIYSLGVLLYELLTGRTPFDGKALLKAGLDEMRRTLREVEPVKPSKMVERESELRVERARERGITDSTLNSQLKSLSTDLDWIVMKCLEKDRNRRYDTPKTLALDLERYMHDEPVLARPPSTGYRLRKFARKHRGPVTAAAGFVLLLTAATAVSALLAVQAHRAQARAEKAEAEAKQNERKSQESKAKAQAALRALEQHVLDKMDLPSTSHNPLMRRSVNDIMMRSLGYLVAIYIEVNQYAEAERLYRECLDRLLKRGHTAKSELLGEVLFGLINVLERQNKFAEAESVRRQQEEMAAAAQLEVLRREQAVAAERARALRAQDPGMIKQWLLLDPIAFAGTNGATALDVEQIPHEARLRPRAGERIKVRESERVWKAVQLDDYTLDFKQLLGEAKEFSVVYAVCYLQSEIDRVGLVMKVGSDDQAKVYLNGREIHRRLNARAYIADQDAVSGVELNAGIHVLVFKVVNETMGSQGSIRFTDAADQPLNGIEVTLDPEDR